jgi:thioredoxin reductase (NADPH)
MFASQKSQPAIVVVDDRESTLTFMVESLRRRFGADYAVVGSTGPEQADTELSRLRDSGTETALILANAHMSPVSGTDFLATTRAAFPTARRVVLADFGDAWVMQSVSRATTLGHVDHFSYLPWGKTDEAFLASVGNILADWCVETARGDNRMTIVGERGDEQFHVLTEVLQRWQTYPLRILEAGTPGGDRSIDDLGGDGHLPIVAVSDGRTLTGATVAKVSDMVGAGADTESTVYDVCVIGLGPAGFSAALNAASEGLRVLMINDTFSQASSSPMIRNYLGFPAGVTGAELMRRAWTQALMFGSSARIGRRATAIRREGDKNVVDLDDGSHVRTDIVMLAIGVEYRRMGVPSVDGLVGRGVFYGYNGADALALAGENTAVVGGGNSAVQAAISLARQAHSVHLVVRSDSLAGSASEYLLEQLDVLPNVTVHLNSEVTEAGGDQQLKSLRLRNRVTGEEQVQPASGLFVMIGAVPRTEWLPPEIARDARGFILTGDDGPRPESPEQFRLPFETTMPGVFALGDVRAGSVKRVAAAVGEGSAAVHQVMRYRSRLPARERELGEPLAVG